MSQQRDARHGEGRRVNRQRLRSASLHRPERVFEPPRDVAMPRSLLDFPNPDPMETGELGAIRRHSLPTREEERKEVPLTKPKASLSTETVDNYPHRHKGESWEQFEDRLAVLELERFVQDKPRQTTVGLEKLREGQREEMEKRKKTLRKEDLVSRGDEDDVSIPTRPITPPGPPNQKKDLRPREKEMDRGRFGPLPTKTTGVMFQGLKPIPTDPTIDPPPRVCQNCWLRGHRRQQCSKKVTESCCFNCGRKYVTLATCPRCAEAHERFIREKNQNLSTGVCGRASTTKGVDARKEKSREVAKVPLLFDRTSSRPPIVDKGPEVESIPDAPLPSAEVAPVEVPVVELSQAIADLTRVMAGLPPETINLAVKQLLEERRHAFK
ncbi:uncharacterized protein LOC127290975 [Leptopilina boulardi]|uniref:uncharacterized protein LOC127290975 n=1 Tax=Leptopilina boulardi TaxID=63433 RepID=UPI0021F668C3|nr:uncharacterized protein LOC127290975 [Leptopilina boulardi]